MKENESNEIKVEFKENKKFNYFSIVKWILGLYVIGILLNLNTKILPYVAQFIYTKIIPSEFMTIELVQFAEILREPLIPLVITIPFFIPTAIALLLTNFLLNIVNIFPGIQKKIYLTIMATLMLLISVSTFLFS